MSIGVGWERLGEGLWERASTQSAERSVAAMVIQGKVSSWQRDEGTWLASSGNGGSHRMGGSWDMCCQSAVNSMVSFCSVNQGKPW